MKKNRVYFNIYDTLLLIVDNDVNDLEKVKKLLNKEGFFNIKIANSCFEAIKICKSQNKPYMIITEFDFEKLSGDELIRKIKKFNESCKIIVLSKNQKLSNSFKSLEAGALSFIHKTDYDWEDHLISSVKTWLNHYKQIDFRKTSFREKIQSLEIVNYG